MNLLSKKWPFIIVTLLVWAICGGIAAAFFALNLDHPIQSDWVNILIVSAVPGIFIIGVFVLYRITNEFTRFMFTLVMIALASWIVIRIIRFQVPDTNSSRYLWYSYYCEAIVTSWLSLVLFLLFRQGRLKRLWIPLIAWAVVGIALSALVLTNDFHSLLHTFPSGRQNYLENENGPVYFAVIIFVTVTMVLGFSEILYPLIKTKRIRSAIQIAIPPILFAIYATLYLAGVPWIIHTPFINDLPLAWLLYTIFQLVVCMWYGILSNNGEYEFNLKNCALPIGVLNHERKLLIKSKGYRERPGKNVRIQEAPLTNGYVSIQNDITEITRLREALERRRLKIESARRSLAIEQETSVQNARIRAQAEIYYAMGEITDKSFTNIENLCKTLPDSLTDENRKDAVKVLNQIRFRLGMIKQECMLILKEEPYLTAQEFRLLLDVIHRDVEGFVFEGSAHVVRGSKNVPTAFVLSLVNLILQVTPPFSPETSTAFVSVSLDEEKATFEIESEPGTEVELDKSFASSRGYFLFDQCEDGIYFFRLQKKEGSNHV